MSRKILGIVLAVVMISTLIAVPVSAAGITDAFQSAGGGYFATAVRNGDLITVTTTLKGSVKFNTINLGISFDNSKVQLLKKDKSTPVAAATYTVDADTTQITDILLSAPANFNNSCKFVVPSGATGTGYAMVGYAYTDGTSVMTTSADTDTHKFYFAVRSGATPDSNTFKAVYTVQAKSFVGINGVTYNTSNVANLIPTYFNVTYTDETPAPTPTSAPTPVVTSIDVAGPGSITIPVGDTPNTASYTATVKDQDGNPMAGESVTWALEAPVTGVSLTSSGNTATVSVDKTAVNGSSFNLVATSSTNNTVKKTVTVSLTKAAPVLTSITINGQSSIAIPAAGSTQVAYTYIALDQYGAPIVADVTWSIVESVAGVDVSAAGVVTVANTASAGTFTLKATSGTVSGTKTITLTKAAYSGELAGPTQIPIPPSWSDNSNKRSFMFVSSNLDAAGIAALTFEIWDSSGAVVSDNTIKVTKLLQKGAPVASVDVAPNATAGNYKLVAKVGSDVIATYDFAVTKPATIDSFDVGGDNVTRDDSRSGGKAVTLVAKNSAQITVNITSQAGENTYVIVYDNYPSVKLFGPVKVVNGSFTIDTSTLTPGKHALTVLTSNHMGSNGEYTINDVRTIYVAVEPANKIPVASTRFKSATVSGGKVTLKAQGYKDGDNKNNIGTDPLDNDVEYMFSVLKADRANTKAWKIIRGYSTNNTFTWDYQNDPIFINGGGVGKWMLQVYVRNASSWEWVNSFFIITKDLN